MVIGQQVRARRMQLQLSITDVSRRSGLSVPFLSQLERGNTGASLESLQEIAKALEVSLSYFIHQPSRPNPVRQPQQFQNFFLGASDIAYARMGSGDSECHLEPLMVVLPPKCKEDTLRHMGEVFLMVLQGKLNLCIEGKEHRLECGHTAHFKPGIRFSWRNDTDHEVRLAWVGTPKLF